MFEQNYKIQRFPIGQNNGFLPMIFPVFEQKCPGPPTCHLLAQSLCRASSDDDPGPVTRTVGRLAHPNTRNGFLKLRRMPRNHALLDMIIGECTKQKIPSFGALENPGCQLLDLYFS